MKEINLIEYIVRAKNSRGDIFVPNAMSENLEMTIDLYLEMKKSLTIKSCHGTVWIEKRNITIRSTDYTKTAEKISEGVIEYGPTDSIRKLY